MHILDMTRAKKKYLPQISIETQIEIMKKKWIKGSLFRGKKKYKLHREEKERERAGERVYEYKEPQFKLNIC